MKASAARSGLISPTLFLLASCAGPAFAVEAIPESMRFALPRCWTGSDSSDGTVRGTSRWPIRASNAYATLQFANPPFSRGELASRLKKDRALYERSGYTVWPGGKTKAAGAIDAAWTGGRLPDRGSYTAYFFHGGRPFKLDGDYISKADFLKLLSSLKTRWDEKARWARGDDGLVSVPLPAGWRKVAGSPDKERAKHSLSLQGPAGDRIDFFILSIFVASPSESREVSLWRALQSSMKENFPELAQARPVSGNDRFSNGLKFSFHQAGCRSADDSEWLTGGFINGQDIPFLVTAVGVSASPLSFLQEMLARVKFGKAETEERTMTLEEMRKIPLR